MALTTVAVVVLRVQPDAEARTNSTLRPERCAVRCRCHRSFCCLLPLSEGESASAISELRAVQCSAATGRACGGGGGRVAVRCGAVRCALPACRPVLPPCPRRPPTSSTPSLSLCVHRRRACATEASTAMQSRRWINQKWKNVGWTSVRLRSPHGARPYVASRQRHLLAAQSANSRRGPPTAARSHARLIGNWAVRS